MGSLGDFYSAFGEWLVREEVPAPRRQRFMAFLRRAVEDEIPSRDGELEAMARGLRFADRATVFFKGRHVWVFPAKDGSCASATLTPNWGRGWRTVFKDDFSYHYGSWFFHLAAQYVHRSYLSSALAAFSFVYGTGTDFYGSWVQTRYVDTSEDIPLEVLEELVSVNMDPERVRTSTSAAERRFAFWTDYLNGLDPFIHRMLFQYLRAQQLWNHGFEREAITALDGVVSVASQFGQHRLAMYVEDRAALFTELALSESDQVWLNHLYALRSEYGAHPGWAKWWDFGEMFEGWFPHMEEAVVRLIWRVAKEEERNRVIATRPDSWSIWFRAHARTIFDAVWWRELPVGAAHGA